MRVWFDPAALKGVMTGLGNRQVCIEKKPTGMHIQAAHPDRERKVLEAVKQAMQDQPAPHCLSLLLDAYPAEYPNPAWLDDDPQAYFITE